MALRWVAARVGDREGEEIERRERASERRFLAALDGASRERARGSAGG